MRRAGLDGKDLARVLMRTKKSCEREHVALSLQVIARRLWPQIIGCSELLPKPLQAASSVDC